MKSKSADFAQKRVNDELCQPQTTVRGEAFTDQQEIAFELLARLIRLRVGESFAGVAEPVHDQFQQASINLGAGNPGLARELIANLNAIIRELLPHRLRD